MRRKKHFLNGRRHEDERKPLTHEAAFSELSSQRTRVLVGFTQQNKTHGDSISETCWGNGQVSSPHKWECAAGNVDGQLGAGGAVPTDHARQLQTLLFEFQNLQDSHQIRHCDGQPPDSIPADGSGGFIGLKRVITIFCNMLTDF